MTEEKIEMVASGYSSQEAQDLIHGVQKWRRSFFGLRILRGIGDLINKALGLVRWWLFY
jgi:hypothetical protein